MGQGYRQAPAFHTSTNNGTPTIYVECHIVPLPTSVIHIDEGAVVLRYKGRNFSMLAMIVDGGAHLSDTIGPTEPNTGSTGETYFSFYFVDPAFTITPTSIALTYQGSTLADGVMIGAPYK